MTAPGRTPGEYTGSARAKHALYGWKVTPGRTPVLGACSAASEGKGSIEVDDATGLSRLGCSFWDLSGLIGPSRKGQLLGKVPVAFKIRLLPCFSEMERRWLLRYLILEAPHRSPAADWQSNVFARYLAIFSLILVSVTFPAVPLIVDRDPLLGCGTAGPLGGHFDA